MIDLKLITNQFCFFKSEWPEVNGGRACLYVEGELRSHDPFKLDDGNASINAGVDQNPSLSQHLKVRLGHVNPRVLPRSYVFCATRLCWDVSVCCDQPNILMIQFSSEVLAASRC